MYNETVTRTGAVSRKRGQGSINLHQRQGMPDTTVTDIYATAHPNSRLWKGAAQAAMYELKRKIGHDAYIEFANAVWPEDWSFDVLTWKDQNAQLEAALAQIRLGKLSLAVLINAARMAKPELYISQPKPGRTVCIDNREGVVITRNGHRRTYKTSKQRRAKLLAWLQQNASAQSFYPTGVAFEISDNEN